MIYSIPYLQSFVKDVGLGAPFDRMFPVVEFNFTTNASKPNSGRTTAFANPGSNMGGKICRTWLGSEVTVEQRFGQKRRNKWTYPRLYRRSLAQYFHLDAMGE